MATLDVYISPDDELVTFDEAESGIRTLLQNQPDLGFLSRMRASALARMIVPSERDVKLRRDRKMEVGGGVPWISVRRRMFDGGVMTKAKARINTTDKGSDDGNTDITIDRIPDEERDTNSNALSCDEHVDAGMTAEYLDRLIDIRSAPLQDDARQRQLIAAACPFSLPETTGGPKDQTVGVFRDRDITAITTHDCSVPSLSIRLLARDAKSAGDQVQQMGIAFLPSHGHGHRPMPHSKMTVTFSLDAYLAHLTTLKSGDAVFVLMDVPCSDITKGLKPILGRVLKRDVTMLIVRLDAGLKTLYDGEGDVRVDLNDPSSSDAFVYGSSWKTPMFSRTSMLLPGAVITLVPWMAERSSERAPSAMARGLAKVVQPSEIHAALARTLRHGVNTCGTNLAALSGRDDISLNVRDTEIMGSLVRMCVDVEERSAMIKATANAITKEGSETNPHVSKQHNFRIFLEALRKQGVQLSPKQNRDPSDQGSNHDQQGGFVLFEKAQEPVNLFDGLWPPTSVIQPLADGIVQAGSGGDLMATMAQGYIHDLRAYVNTDTKTLSSVVVELRSSRSESNESEVAEYLASVIKTLSRSLEGAARLEIEMDIAARSDTVPRHVPSPFDTFRNKDIDRWVLSLVKTVDYDEYRGSEQAAFEADVANLRLTYEDRAFYRTFKDDSSATTTTLKEVPSAFPNTTILFQFLVEGCEVHGLRSEEIAAVHRNVSHYRPEEDTDARIRRRIELVKQARNRPEFKEKRFTSRQAIERRLIGRVHASALHDHAVQVLHMLGALLVLLIQDAPERIKMETKIVGQMIGGALRSKSIETDGVIMKVASGVGRILQALVPKDGEKDEERIDHVAAIIADIALVKEDKKAQGVTLVTEDDGRKAIIRSRATRDTIWPHFRPYMSNLSNVPSSKLSRTMAIVAALQRPFRDALPLDIKMGAKRPERYNVCCVYNLSGVLKPMISASSPSQSSTRARARTTLASSRFPTILKGTIAASVVAPISAAMLLTRELLLPTPSDMGDLAARSMSNLAPNWTEKTVLSFLEDNGSYEKDAALARVASMIGQGAGADPKVAWSALATQNLARFEELAARVSVAKERLDLIRTTLLTPTISFDGIVLQEQQHHARRFLMSIVVPLFGRLSNGVRDKGIDPEADRLNAIMAAHDLTTDVLLMRSTLSTYGSIKSVSLLMLAAGPLRAPVPLRYSVQLHMGVALTALWRLVAETGSGGLGASVSRPVVQLSLDRLAEELRFALADDSVTTKIQEQREDEKNRKIAIFERIPPEDIAMMREYRKIIKPDRLGWDKIEQEFAKEVDRGEVKGVEAGGDDRAQEQQEIAALGIYPDDERDFDVNDADQEIMEYDDNGVMDE